ncbi:MAG: hypothetical protein QME65_02650 [Candidatus Omnitrophota bacterium]|nr:hypothetical protein [Candidatus Omnitrophota bacterium]
MKSLIITLVLFLAFLSPCAFAEEITIIYTGETHAMLYPCNCPKEPDGGIARRAALVKQLREKYPASLVLDSGNFFSGGLLDEYTQNTSLDKKRAIINLKGMGMMGYDAVAIGDAEFNFGKEFLLENIGQAQLAFLSCNINFSKFLPALVKEIAGIKIGIIGLTSPLAAQKAGGLKFIDPRIALAAEVNELKKSGVNLIVLLSNLQEKENLGLIENIKGIDIIIEGGDANSEPFKKVGDTLVVESNWQGRRLDKLTFSFKDNKVTDFKVENLRLSDEIKDDPDTLSLLPRCFANANCRKGGLEGACKDPGENNASCVFEKPNAIKLLVISASICKTCNTYDVIESLKKYFPGLDISYLYYPGRKAQEIINNFAITALPAYLFGTEIERDKKFDNFKGSLEKKEGYYLLSPQASGIAYFVDRIEEKQRFDLFLSLFDKNSRQILELTREFSPRVHFLAVEKEGSFDAAAGNIEVEEYLRAVCLKKYYPEKFWDYISCRSANINTSWWEDCAGGLDTHKIKTCARGEEGKTLLKDNISLNKEIRVLFGPVYMINNREIFSSKGAPSKEELERIIKR